MINTKNVLLVFDVKDHARLLARKGVRTWVQFILDMEKEVSLFDDFKDEIKKYEE